jgi:hypothetical protein
MSTPSQFSIYRFLSVCIFALFLILLPNQAVAVNDYKDSKKGDSENFTEYKGKITDKKNGKALAFAGLIVAGTNISTISNSEGEFSLKIPNEVLDPKVTVSYIGYKNRSIALADLKSEKTRIEMEATSILLPELNVIAKDAEVLIRTVLERRAQNYFNTPTPMTAFYRETIKKNRSYVSLAEAVVEIDKQPYTSYKPDAARLYKARKKADYAKLDTLSFKLQGGPFNSLYLDIMKYPEFIFTEDMIGNYQFSFDHSTYTDNRLIYVVDFKQRPNKTEPLYYGKLYIDAQNMALQSAVFSLNITDKDASAAMFIKKKPFNARVYPTEAKYRIDYLEKDGKWYYSYSRIELGLKIIWKKKLFNTNYFSTVEMAVTDWSQGAENKSGNFTEKLKPSVIISDEASGFTDAQFWGEYNVIEPEKSIDSAIRKIQKKLEKK